MECRLSCHRSNRDNFSDNIEEIVHRFIVECRPRAEKEKRYCKLQPDLKKAIEITALAILPGGKRHLHQRRIPQNALEEAKDRLFSADFKHFTAFDELFKTAEKRGITSNSSNKALRMDTVTQA